MFILTKLLGWLAAPSSLLLLMLCVGTALALRGHVYGPRLVAAAVTLWLLIAILPLSAWLLLPLERRFPRPAPPAQLDGIILLGGIVRSDLTDPAGPVSLSDRADRLTEFLILARKYPQAKLVFAGGFNGFTNDRPEADDIRRISTDLGLDPARVIWEGKSRTTYENALLAKPLAQPKPGETWLLITSAWHMPRSVAVFQAQDWPVMPWPVDARANPRLGFDPVGRLQQLDLAAKEYQGLAAYRLSGKTISIWP